MASLQLTLLEGNALNERSVFTVSHTGATVGRSRDCDWVLLDNDRFISNKHMLISFRENQFYINDLSSNGVFVNGSQDAIGKGNSKVVETNDIITLGKFRILISDIELEKAADAYPRVSSNYNYHQQQAPSTGYDQNNNAQDNDSAVGLFDILNNTPAEEQSSQSQQDVFEAQFDNSEKGQEQKQASNYQQTIPDDWDFLDLAPSESDHDDSPMQTSRSANFEPSQQSEHAVEAKVEIAPEVTKQLTSNNSDKAAPEKTHNKTLENQSDDFFDYLYRALGLPKEYKHSVDKHTFADDLVSILLTSTQGIMALLAGRSLFKQESRLNLTMIKPQSNNPIKFSLDPTDTLEMLLVKKKPGYMSAQSSYSEALNDIQIHQMAFLSGLQACLEGMVERMNPTRIEALAENQPTSLIDINKNAAKWKAFKAQQERLKKQVNENLNDLLSQYFSDAYEKYIQEHHSNEAK
ncbi:type VI secretion system-associated FHA domain protein TagH [Glaciecola sp. 1036]|uniref:type VI secretion system-associated FHA domain protein TagH n=1 Tax=Alteromonadaceae TaxID=72275 RepID=UPI003D04DF25